MPLGIRDAIIDLIIKNTEESLALSFQRFDDAYLNKMAPILDETVHVSCYRNYINSGERQVTAGLMIQKLDEL